MIRRGVIALLLLAPSAATGLPDGDRPRIGYAYPAGGRRGTTVSVMLGGRNLAGADGVLVSGTGVRSAAVRHLGRFLFLNGDERREVLRRLRAAKAAGGEDADLAEEFPMMARMTDDPDSPIVELPKHPLLDRIGKLTPPETDYLVHVLLKPDPKTQRTTPLVETVLVNVEIAPDAPPGERDFRLTGPWGLTNPVVFQVGVRPEVLEPEPYDEKAAPAPAADAPVTINGQIRPGDADRFRFRAVRDRPLAIRVHSRRLVPFIADAVPGWCQAVLTLRDGKGRELARSDDWRFDPDPLILFRPPETAEYELEIRDAIWRGREDFVYRIHIAEDPFVTGLFPAGGRAGEAAETGVLGANLGGTRLTLDTRPGPDRIRDALAPDGGPFFEGALYEVDDFPEVLEAGRGGAQSIALPCVVNGRIGAPGEQDAFRFAGRKGEEVVAEVTARKLGSPLDGLVHVVDASGRVVAWNDDDERKDGHLRTDYGAVTHHADPLLRATLPADGVYEARVSDAQRRGGEDFVYRLRLGPPRPDFELRAAPSTLNLRAGITEPLVVHVLRRDGFDGPIDLALRDAPAGLRLDGGTVPAGCNRLVVTLTPPRGGIGKPVAIRLEGRATLRLAPLVHPEQSRRAQGEASGDRQIVRTAVPCEDAMQAFLWRHLLPVRELVAAPAGKGGRQPPPEAPDGIPVRIPRGGEAEVTVRAGGGPRPGQAKNMEIEFQLDDAPEGVRLSSAARDGGVVKLRFAADPDKPAAGAAGNLVVGVYLTPPAGDAKNTPARKRKIAVGALPAIPFRIVSNDR